MGEIRYYYLCHQNYVTITLPNPKNVLDQIQWNVLTTWFTNSWKGYCLVTKLCPILLQPHEVCLASLSMGFPRQEYWSGLPFPSPIVWPVGTKLLVQLSPLAFSFHFCCFTVFMRDLISFSKNIICSYQIIWLSLKIEWADFYLKRDRLI